MTSGLQRVVYTTIIVGATMTGGYVIDKTFHLGIKEKVAGALIDNPKDAAKILFYELDKSRDVRRYQGDLSDLIVKGASYMNDTVKVLTADELLKMSSPNVQESYIEFKLKQLPDDKKMQLAEKTLQNLPPYMMMTIVEDLPDSIQNGMVKVVAKERLNELGGKINDIFNDIGNGMKKAYDGTIGKLCDKK